MRSGMPIVALEIGGNVITYGNDLRYQLVPVLALTVLIEAHLPQLPEKGPPGNPQAQRSLFPMPLVPL